PGDVWLHLRPGGLLLLQDSERGQHCLPGGHDAEDFGLLRRVDVHGLQQHGRTRGRPVSRFDGRRQERVLRLPGAEHQRCADLELCPGQRVVAVPARRRLLRGYRHEWRRSTPRALSCSLGGAPASLLPNDMVTSTSAPPQVSVPCGTIETDPTTSLAFVGSAPIVGHAEAGPTAADCTAYGEGSVRPGGGCIDGDSTSARLKQRFRAVSRFATTMRL